MVKVFQLPVQSPVESGADSNTGQPKFDVIYMVHDRVLGGFQSAIDNNSSTIKEAHSNHCEDDADGGKNNLGQRDT